MSARLRTIAACNKSVLAEAQRDCRLSRMAKRPQLAPSVDDILSDWRNRWNEQRKWGLKQDLSLPPLSGAQVHEAMALNSEFYWRGGFVVLGDNKRLHDECRAAIALAGLENPRKAPKKSRIRAALIERDGSACWFCGEELHGDCTIEHKVAKANGGDWSLGNLVLAHEECNRSMGRLPLKAKEAARDAMLADRARRDAGAV